MVVHEQPGELGASHLSVMPENAAGEDEDEPLAAQVTAACNKASTGFEHHQSRGTRRTHVSTQKVSFEYIYMGERCLSQWNTRDRPLC